MTFTKYFNSLYPAPGFRLHRHLSSNLLNIALLFFTFMVYYLSPLGYKLHEIHEIFDLFTVVFQSPRPLPGT